MIPASRLVAATALLVALGVHASALILRSGPQEVQIEGGAPAAVTALGNAFSDMVAGTSTPVEAEVSKVETPPDSAQKPDPAKPTKAATPAEVSPAATPPVTKATNSPPTQSSQAPLIEQTTAAIQLPTSQPEPTEATSPTVQPSPSADERAATTPTTTALTYNEPVAVPAVRPVARPVANPVQVPDQPTEATATPIKPVKPTKPIKPVVKQQPKPKATPRAQGNSDKNAKRGTSTGTQPKAKAKSGTDNTRSSTQGNAATTNYKGRVYRKINRKKLRVNIKGTVRVSFGISASGALSRLAVSRSSGSAKLDQLALQQVRRAAPFGAPPGGKQMSFSVEIRSKR